MFTRRPPYPASDRNTKTKTTNLNPEQFVGIGEDFHRQVDDDKVKTNYMKFVGTDMIEQVIHGNRSQGYASMVKVWNLMRKMLRDWLLTVVRQNQKTHILSKTLPCIKLYIYTLLDPSTLW